MDLNKILKRSEVLFLRYGIKSVTMDDLAREIGISKKTLYLHFDTKNKLIEQIIATHTVREQCLISEIVQTSADALDEILKIAQYITLELARLTPTVVYDLQKYHRDAWDSREKSSNEFIYGIIRQNLERGIHEKLYRSNLDSDIVAKLYVGKSNVIVDETLFPQAQYPKVALFKQFINYHLHGILSPSGLERLNAMQQYSTH
jgi:TetR/AcrR family transcriptional regulator, cholesterol catabolism regulator